MKERREIELDGVDLLLLTVVTVLGIVTLFLLFPGVRDWWFGVVDVLGWSRWKWFAVNAVVMVVLILVMALIRFWPRRGRDG